MEEEMVEPVYRRRRNTRLPTQVASREYDDQYSTRSSRSSPHGYYLPRPHRYATPDSSSSRHSHELRRDREPVVTNNVIVATRPRLRAQSPHSRHRINDYDEYVTSLRRPSTRDRKAEHEPAYEDYYDEDLDFTYRQPIRRHASDTVLFDPRYARRDSWSHEAAAPSTGAGSSRYPPRRPYRQPSYERLSPERYHTRPNRTARIIRAPKHIYDGSTEDGEDQSDETTVRNDSGADRRTECYGGLQATEGEGNQSPGRGRTLTRGGISSYATREFDGYCTPGEKVHEPVVSLLTFGRFYALETYPPEQPTATCPFSARFLGSLDSRFENAVIHNFDQFVPSKERRIPHDASPFKCRGHVRIVEARV
ncbi:MAG: hypothetical protein MMC23_006483 [Stictis urceolatum]|nr:hypothetical protein [Stictis urceolata]